MSLTRMLIICSRLRQRSGSVKNRSFWDQHCSPLETPLDTLARGPDSFPSTRTDGIRVRELGRMRSATSCCVQWGTEN